ncbi:unnamed protein product [Cunninghamella echinulata]
MLLGYWNEVSVTNPFMKDKKIAIVESVSLLTDQTKGLTEESKQIGRTRIVIGWYHSHPHITVFPSHIDLQTQYSQQMMDEHFFGIIISCFDKSEDNSHRIQTICFQSQPNDRNILTQVHIPLDIQPTDTFFPDTLRSLTKVPSLIYEEYNKEFDKFTKTIQYHNYNNSNNNASPLKNNNQNIDDFNNKNSPNHFNCMYNANVYAQSIIQLVDTTIIPSTYLMNLRAQHIEQEIKRLQELKKQLLLEREKDNTSLIDLN